MNPYRVLGVDRGFTRDELRSAYRDLCMRHHPDRNPGDVASEERFKEVSQAYQILSDPDKKRNYDLGGHMFGGDIPAGVPEEFRETVEGFVNIFSDFLETSPLFEDTRQTIEQETRAAAATAARQMDPKTRKRVERAVRKSAKNVQRNTVRKVRKAAPRVPKCAKCNDTRSLEVVQGAARFKIPCRFC